MKTSVKFTVLVLATIAIGAIGFSVAQASFTANLPLGLIVAVGASFALVAFAIADYSRRAQPLTINATILRPNLTPTKPASPRGQSNHSEQLAA